MTNYFTPGTGPKKELDTPSTVPAVRGSANLPTFADVVGRSKDSPMISGASLAGEDYLRLDKEQKRQLVGVMLVIEGWDIRDGDNGFYSVVRVLTEKNERYSFTDGGVGVTPALLQASGGEPGPSPEGAQIFCRFGLRASDYEYNGRPATTYYLT